MACEYCTPDENGECCPVGSFPDAFWLAKKEDRWELYSNMGSRQQVYHCPMCGEKLGDAE